MKKEVMTNRSNKVPTNSDEVTKNVLAIIEKIRTAPMELVSSFEEIEEAHQADSERTLVFHAVMTGEPEQEVPVLNPYLNFYKNKDVYQDLDDKILPKLFDMKDVSVEDAKHKMRVAAAYIDQREGALRGLFINRIRLLANNIACQLNCNIIKDLEFLRSQARKEFDDYQKSFEEYKKENIEKFQETCYDNKTHYVMLNKIRTEFDNQNREQYNYVSANINSIENILGILKHNRVESPEQSNFVGVNRIKTCSDIISECMFYLYNGFMCREKDYLYHEVDRHVEQIDDISAIISTIYLYYDEIFAAECQTTEFYTNVLNIVYGSFVIFKHSLIRMRDMLLIEIDKFYEDLRLKGCREDINNITATLAEIEKSGNTEDTVTVTQF